MIYFCTVIFCHYAPSAGHKVITNVPLWLIHIICCSVGALFSSLYSLIVPAWMDELTVSCLWLIEDYRRCSRREFQMTEAEYEKLLWLIHVLVLVVPVCCTIRSHQLAECKPSWPGMTLEEHTNTDSTKVQCNGQSWQLSRHEHLIFDPLHHQ